MHFSDYVEAYNTNDKDAKGHYFTDDITVEGAHGSLEGKEAVLAFFADAHSEAKERLRPLVVVEQGEHIMAEFDAEFVAKKDILADSMLGELTEGEAAKLRFFAVYKLRDGLICEMRLAIWPQPERIEPF
ncbi:hypothetical protein MPH_03841 [Macrophomina phaseolina MS6]|uniref:SnoaL-like domain-containing protein n=1 Tax=Macrophomina phaseolina (strain MS6) TaxID=1126212 RepID=K2SQ09_MACPH|nr:hypothetical protein MPH_03841 [Macrophomina phaseolina MS6]